MTKGELTRQKIVAAAAPIFNQRGYAGCSMQDVLDATGLEKGGLYRHFSSKEELAAKAFQYAWAQVVKTRLGDLAEIPHAVAKLRYAIDRFVTITSPIPGGCPLMNTAVDADDGNPQLRDLARQGIKDWKKRIVKIVRDGIRRKEIRKDTDPQRIANHIIAILEGSLLISRMEGSRNAMKDAQIELEAMLDRIAASPSAAHAMLSGSKETTARA
ncbi:MAG TPA: TetR/AcrR family transcriptional regulator [Acidobacteriaceae bacterium]